MSLSTLDRVLVLKGAEIFSQVPGEDLAPLARVAQEVEFVPGAHIVRQGEPGDCLLVIVEGQASIVVPGTGVVATRGPGSCVGEMSVVTRRLRSADCVALTPVRALRVEGEDFWDLLGERPPLALGLIRALGDRLTEAVGNLSDNR